MLVDGYRCRCRSLVQVAASGTSVTKFLSAAYSSTGVIVLDRTAATDPIATGADPLNPSELRQFNDPGVDFTTMNIQPGDVLTITSPVNSPLAGRYLIKGIVDSHNLQIVSVFSASLSGLKYKIEDPWAPTYSVDSTEPTAGSGKLCLGEVDLDGSGAVTAIRARNFLDFYASEWRAIDTSVGFVEQTFNHNLGSDVLQISVQVKSTLTGMIEELSTADLDNTVALSFTNSITKDPDIFNPGTSDATFTEGALHPTLSASLSGGVSMTRSAKIKWSTNQVVVKNMVSGVFFRDYAGVLQTAGYIRVVVRRVAA